MMAASLAIFRRSRLWVVVLLGMAHGDRVSAHPMGGTHVVITLKAGSTCEIAIVTDPIALLERLETLAGEPTTGDRDRRLAELAPVLLSHIDLAFDGVSSPLELAQGFAAAPRIVNLMPDAPALDSAVFLTARVPVTARRVSWKSSFLYGAYPMVVRLDPGDPPAIQWLQGSESSAPIHLRSGALTGSEIWRYLKLGFGHVLPDGVNHILFVFGILLLSARFRDVGAQVGAFAIAHSVALSLSMYGFVTLPSSVVEPLIALSIAYVALENLLTARLSTARIVLVFAAGLLHGLGLAGSLAGTGVPRAQLLGALISFNVSAEAAVFALAGLMLVAVNPWRQHPAIYRRFITVPGSLAIGGAGLAWTLSRTLG